MLKCTFFAKIFRNWRGNFFEIIGNQLGGRGKLSEMIDLIAAMLSIKFSSKSELSRRFFSHLKISKKLVEQFVFRAGMAFIADWDDIIPVIPCHWDEIIPVDGGWLPQWGEALDELAGKIEAVYFAI